MGVTALVTRQIVDAIVTTVKLAANAVTLTKMGWGTAKGDLLVAQSSTVYGNLAVGSNTQILMADSTQTNGIKWIAQGTDTLTTKGDILTRSASALVRLGVGSDGQVLTADSTQADGIKWNTPPALAASNFVFSEVPSGTVDGTNATFTLANTPTSGTERVHVNGLRMHAGAGNDYTISTTTITFLTGAIPQTGDVILVDYLK